MRAVPNTAVFGGKPLLKSEKNSAAKEGKIALKKMKSPTRDPNIGGSLKTGDIFSMCPKSWAFIEKSQSFCKLKLLGRWTRKAKGPNLSPIANCLPCNPWLPGHLHVLPRHPHVLPECSAGLPRCSARFPECSANFFPRFQYVGWSILAIKWQNLPFG